MKWISVKERFPNLKEQPMGILVFDEEDGVREAEYSNGKFDYPYCGQDISGSFSKVTHWRLMPKKPN